MGIKAASYIAFACVSKYPWCVGVEVRTQEHVRRCSGTGLLVYVGDNMYIFNAYGHKLTFIHSACACLVITQLLRDESPNKSQGAQNSFNSEWPKGWIFFIKL